MHNDAYRVIIDGEPSVTQETTFRAGPKRDANVGGCLATGMRAIHAIPALRGKVGLLSALDLPLATGLGTIR